MRSALEPDDDADRRIRAVAAAYPRRVPRTGLDAVERLAAAAGAAPPPHSTVVVGTNGKTSTATYLARWLRRAGLACGLTISPHILRWGERAVVDGVPADDAELAVRIERLHALARGLELTAEVRFFDLVTLAAAELFAEAGVEYGVFEAGIGGRLDAARILDAELVVLTGVGLDHQDLLGETEVEILREKLGVAPAGATVVSAPLAPQLAEAAEAFAAAHALRLRFAAAPGGGLLAANAELARRAALLLGVAAPAGSLAEIVARPVAGRLQRLDAGGVEVLLDAAHNAQAWSAVASALPERFVCVVSASADRDPAALAPALRGAAAVVATEAWADRSRPAAALAAALGGETVDVVEDPAGAVRRGLDLARARSLPLVVLGSAYLLPHAFRALGLEPLGIDRGGS